MSDLIQTLEARAVSYEQSGPSAHHTAALLRQAKTEIEQLQTQCDFWQGAYDRCNQRVCQLLEERLAERASQQAQETK